VHVHVNRIRQDDSFDVVIDKSLLDCIFHCEEYEVKVAGMLEELHRVLRKDTGLVVFFTIQPATEVSLSRAFLPLTLASCVI
jgi:hypothetical protein